MCGRETVLRRRAKRLSHVLSLASMVVLMSTPGSHLWAQRLSPRDVDAMPAKPADARVAYGKEPAQFGELRLPTGTGPVAIVTIIHGGCWMAEVATLRNTAAFADALRDAGVATWNVEYRRVGDEGGGWPGTFEDIAAAVDHMRALSAEYGLDGTRTIVTGHSAGAHLALWAAARSRLPESSPLYNALPMVIKTAMPLGVRQVLIVGEDDPVMPARSREAYVEKAKKAGDPAELIVVPGGHFEVIAPGTAAFAAVKAKILDLLGL